MDKNIFNIIQYIANEERKEISPKKLFLYKLYKTDWKQSDFTREELCRVHTPGDNTTHNLALNISTSSTLTKLPDYLQLGSLEIRSNLILELPDYLYIERNLFLQESLINSLPIELYVGRNLYLPNNEIIHAKLPDDLTVGGFIVLYDQSSDNVKMMKKLNPRFANQITNTNPITN